MTSEWFEDGHQRDRGEKLIRSCATYLGVAQPTISGVMVSRTRIRAVVNRVPIEAPMELVQFVAAIRKALGNPK